MRSSLRLRFAIVVAVMAWSPAFAADKDASPGAAEVANAERLITSRLKDPDSVQFRNVQFRPETKAVCGEFNAKNSYGGYVGYKQFSMDSEGVIHQYISANEIHPSNNGEKLQMLKAAMADLEAIKRDCEAWAKEMDAASH